MKKIIINKPEILSGIDDEHCRLSAKIESDHFIKDLYFEIECKYKEYLCDERGDAFLLSLLNFSLINGYNMEFKVPISEKLYYQIVEQYIPTLTKYNPYVYNKIKISAKLDNKCINNAGAVGASASGGVDSFYTIIKNSNKVTKHYNITHLMIASVYNIYYGENDTRKRFEKTIYNATKVSKELNLPLVSVYSNDHEFWYKGFADYFETRYISYIYALQKLFYVYHYSAGYEYKDFSFNKDDKFDFVRSQLISSENLTIYSSGPEVSRIEKVEYIANNTSVQKLLSVCNFSYKNCCKCSKCMRTQMELWSIGMLKKFKLVFPENYFSKQFNKELRTMIARRNKFDKDILNNIKKNKLNISFMTMIMGNLIHYMWYCPKNLLKKISSVKKTYDKVMDNKRKNSNIPEEKTWYYSESKEFAFECDNNIVS